MLIELESLQEEKIHQLEEENRNLKFLSNFLKYKN